MFFYLVLLFVRFVVGSLVLVLGSPFLRSFFVVTFVTLRSVICWFGSLSSLRCSFYVYLLRSVPVGYGSGYVRWLLVTVKLIPVKLFTFVGLLVHVTLV